MFFSHTCTVRAASHTACSPFLDASIFNATPQLRVSVTSLTRAVCSSIVIAPKPWLKNTRKLGVAGNLLEQNEWPSKNKKKRMRDTPCRPPKLNEVLAFPPNWGETRAHCVRLESGTERQANLRYIRATIRSTSNTKLIKSFKTTDKPLCDKSHLIPGHPQQFGILPSELIATYLNEVNKAWWRLERIWKSLYLYAYSEEPRSNRGWATGINRHRRAQSKIILTLRVHVNAYSGRRAQLGGEAEEFALGMGRMFIYLRRLIWTQTDDQTWQLSKFETRSIRPGSVWNKIRM
ncbi:hypothetical protein B0H16DRAFT_1684251 [Mycena metata]|uniref:Uncharacterized protein n=1 Tax=Mycena metata TaxID=1033252 RepID=A0AAD7K3L6_9AGAR|nr:hypothetical protein B0H16DRAFT_1684251 [Mycena metata]